MQCQGCVPNTELNIANWNLQIFGITKAQDLNLMNTYKDKMDNYDIVFIEEIRDESNTAFPKLCSMLQGYKCYNSSRAGRSSSKEQYGIIYKDYLNLSYATDYNPDSMDRWERPPFNVIFTINQKDYSFWVMHTKPEDAYTELVTLESVVPKTGNQIIVGDLNADCFYYSGGAFTNWFWTLNADTTSGNTVCTYDNFILNSETKNLYVASTIDSSTSSYESDHYLISLKVKI